eukprot:TRINITY_DN6033_c0_g2_i1.p1 TRINITY_DN6033_c0_g2~~TRINITY_DN6033_c0_g2_i1.p1  ORF type:complete len:496 (-),score=101.81 TRINITY_DN6033_c0_g2_i1:1168-2655(-)
MVPIRLLMFASLAVLFLVAGYSHHALSKKQKEKDDLQQQLVTLQSEKSELEREKQEKEAEIEALTARYYDLQHLFKREKFLNKESNNNPQQQQEEETDNHNGSFSLAEELSGHHQRFHEHAEEPQAARSKKARLLICVMSGLDNFARRDAIRQTWGRYVTDPNEVTVIFVLADLVYARDNQTLHSLLEEDRKYHDILALTGVREEYKALGDRLFHMLFEVTEQYDYMFMMKTDDDSYIRVTELMFSLCLHFIKQMKEYRTEFFTSANASKIEEAETWDPAFWPRGMVPTRFYWGFFMSGNQVQGIGGRWSNPEYLKLNSHYPSYAAGSGYILSRDLILWMIKSDIPMKIWKDGPEDSQIGTWLSGLDIDRVSVRSRIYGKGASGSCDTTETLLLHGLFSEDNFHSCYLEDTVNKDVCRCSFVAEWQERNAPAPVSVRRRERFSSLLSKESTKEIRVKFYIDILCWLLIAGIVWLLCLFGVVSVMEKIFLCLEVTT